MNALDACFGKLLASDFSFYCKKQDDLDMSEMHGMEEARLAYIAAVATAKERQDDGSVAAASKARLHLQSFAFRN